MKPTTHESQEAPEIYKIQMAPLQAYISSKNCWGEETSWLVSCLQVMQGAPEIQLLSPHLYWGGFFDDIFAFESLMLL